MDRELQGSTHLNVANEKIRNDKQTMNAFCSMHQGLRVEYVSVDPKQDFVFKCVNCISEENVQQSTLIPINLILSSNAKTIFTNFPITDRNLAIELRTLAQAPTTSEQITLKIQSFFKEFRVNLLHKLEIVEQKMIEKAKSISDFGSIIEQYNQICAKKELKAIVNDNGKELSVKSAEIKTICQEILNKEQEHNSSIRISLERLKTIQSAMDFETPVSIKEQIFSQIDKIDMFLVEDFKQFQELVERKENQKNQNISNLIKLVNNKLNGISYESCERLKEQLHRISFAFSAIEVPEVGVLGTYLESLNKNSSAIIQKLVEDLAKNQQANEVDDEKENKENLNARDLLELVSNKTNFCSNEYIEDVAQVVNTLESVLGQFLVRKPRIKTEEQSAFNKLNQNQLLNLAKLAIKINSITEQHSDSYLNSLAPLSSIQPNSNVIKRILNKNKSLDDLSSNESRNQVESLDRILVNYPIFELLSPISYKLLIIPIPISFTKTNNYFSQEIQITENGRSILLSLDPTKNGQVVSEILDNSLGYLLKLKFTRPIAFANNGFLIGLIPNSSINSTHVLSNSNESGLRTNPNFGAKVILKGRKLTSENLSMTTDCFEFRFCISNQLFLYADPSYSNINQAETRHFDPKEQYRFGLYLRGDNTRPNNMQVSVCEFGIIDPEEVSNFQ